MEILNTSLTKTIKERLSGPFYGVFIINWLILNWKVWYVTIFISSENLPYNKISYIDDELSNYWKSIVFPVFTSLFFIFVFPFFNNVISHTNDIFRKKKREKKILLDKKSVLTLEESNELRGEMLKTRK